MYYVLQHFGVVVGAISGILAAEGKRIDLFVAIQRKLSLPVFRARL
jgi:uncharacterized membrane protein YeiH